MKEYIEIEKYDQVVLEFSTHKAATSQKIADLQFQLSELKRLIFGAKSERYIPDVPDEQLSLFEQEKKEVEEKYVEEVPAHQRVKVKEKKKPVRLKLPTHLRVEEHTIEPGIDTSNMVQIGVEETKSLAYTPAELYIVQINRPKYVVRNQSTSANDTTEKSTPKNPTSSSEKGPVYIAPLPSRFIDKCIAHESLLTAILVDKYVDHLPLFRTQSRIQRTAGLRIPRSTLSGWVAQSAEKLLVLYTKLQQLVLLSVYLQIDETRMEVLPEKRKQQANAPPNKRKTRSGKNKKGKNKKRKTHRGFLFGYLAMQEQLVFFEYDKTRTANNPLRCLANYKGTIQTDCYDVYDQIRKLYAQQLIHFHCLNHARRNFEKALDNDAAKAGYVLGQFQRLYAIEEVAREKKWSVDKIKQVRQEQAKPILEDLFDWMQEKYDQVLPASNIAIAFKYMLKRKERMMHYLSDGRLHIDNNPIENAFRKIAVGRRNYLFAGSHQAAQHAAMFYSFFACCQLHDVDPTQWLQDVMQRLPEHPVNQIEQLLPHLWKKNNPTPPIK